jgi:transposase
MPMVIISIVLPMHFDFEAMALYKVFAMNRYARVALMKSTFNVPSVKQSHMHSHMAQSIISTFFLRWKIILKS